jgi:hypothetical protein
LQHGRHRFGDRHVDRKFVRAPQHRVCAVHALGDMAQIGQHLGQRFAGRQLQADGAVAGLVAGGSEHQIAQPGQPHEGFGARAQRQAEPRHLGQSARDQRGAPVQPRHARCAAGCVFGHAVADAGGNRQHVFHRPAYFDANRVVRGVDAKHRAVKGRDGQLADGRFGAGRDQRGGLPARHLAGKARPRQHAHMRARAHLLRHLMAQVPGAGLEALAQPQRARTVWQQRERFAQARHRRRDDVKAALRVPERGAAVVGDAQRSGQLDARQVTLVGARAAHRLGLPRIAHPQAYRVARRGLHRQRGAPGTGTQNADVHACAERPPASRFRRW